MPKLDETIVALLADLAKATEGLLHRTRHLAQDKQYNEDMQKSIAKNRDLLLEAAKDGSDKSE
jgi:hypothetical protein